ncbi:hypothetical protein LAJ19_05185 [Deinococcus taeanensis]|uniref:hypothetical protein n=1 Tax=Deinococcus taeanensis TaxID=2737050 RepID=UPI001CDB4DFB|nr:hypothetical protein [Deinococcus taeanensis]UBV43610.1 hypothetical protein LAJ19_05185 [Deinococcus taeanensis]
MKNRLPLIAFAALPLTAGLVLAQQGAATSQTPQRVQPAQPGQRSPAQQNQTQPAQRPQLSGTNYADAYLKNLAQQLGVTPEKLKAAAVKAGTATIDAALKAGDVPSDRAAEMKQRLADNPFAFAGHGPGGHGRHGGPMGPDGPRGDHEDQGASAPVQNTDGSPSGT